MNKSDCQPSQLPAGHVDYTEMDQIRVQELKERVMAAIQNALRFGEMDNTLNADLVENAGAS